jgi:cell shape-determining protein MreC
MMGSKTTTSKRTVFLGCFLGATIVLLVPHGLTSKCQYAFRRVFCVPLGISRSLTLVATTPAPPEISSEKYRTLQQEFQKLANHTANLTAVITKQEETINRLAKLRVRPEWQKFSLVPANVFTAQGDDQVVINRGSRDLVKLKCFILANNAIVGKVSEIQKHQATIELISHQGAFMPVYIDTRETQGACFGLGQGQLEIQNVRYTRPVKIGQSVYTSNQPWLLGTPIIVGKVASCERDEKKPYLWKIEMAPAVDPKQLDQVDVVLPGKL